MRLRGLNVLLAALCFLGTAAAFDPSFEQRFEEGNRLYSEGLYSRAAQEYRSILDSGLESAELYHNLGNCRFKEGDFARALLNYRRAARLAPGDEAIQANLELARSMMVDEIVPLPRFWLFDAGDSWLQLFSLRGWFVAASLAWVLAGLALCLRLLLKTGVGASWSLRASVGLAVLALIFLASLAVGEARLEDRSEAVIMAREVAVRSAPDEDPDLELFTIHRGTTVRIEQSTGEWAEVVLADGKVGWVKQEAYEII